jgi:hypothetical protein
VLRLGRKHDDRQVGIARLVDVVTTVHAAAQVDPLTPGSTTSSSIRSGCDWTSSPIASSAAPAVSTE